MSKSNKYRYTNLCDLQGHSQIIDILEVIIIAERRQAINSDRYLQVQVLKY